MEFTDKSCKEFMAQLGSSTPVPGGGGASAMAGALGIASGNMMARLTLGKKKYAAVQDEFTRLIQKAEELQTELLAQVERDAQAFRGLYDVYLLPEGDKQQITIKAEKLEDALQMACKVPYKTIELCCEAIVILEIYGAKGTANALSEASVGVSLCSGALKGAASSVFINTKLMQNREYANRINQNTDRMIAEYTARAEKLFAQLAQRLK